LLKENTTVNAMVEWMVCSDITKLCIAPEEKEFSINIGVIPSTIEPIHEAKYNAENPDSTKKEEKNGSLWAMIIEAILWGFAALLTPCVFPMIPMTVSFFIKGSQDKSTGRFRALIYGLFIILLYTIPIGIIIVITRIIGGDAVTADIFNWLATHWLPNLLFFAVFMIFAASFFGAFEIVMPSKLVNKSDSNTEKKGLGGVFFMALTLVLVSFSCTGPIVGTVLIKSTAGEFWAPILTMFAFSVAFALPFTLFALFPSWLNKMPKSGGWLNSVKIVLGFIELALGLKFLSIADQTYHWGILDREIYLALWIVIFTLLGFYLLGKLHFKNDSEVKHISVTRLILSIIVFSFVVYMLPGMWGAPLKGLSGYLPPIQTQDFILSNDNIQPTYKSSTTETPKKYSDFLELPHNLDGFFDVEDAVKYADKVGKPLFIDFTGHGCVNCREMEARVWSDPEVLDILRNEYVIVALYSDDKKVVDEKDWVTTETGKTLKTLGKINSYYALKNFNVNAQPYYVLKGRNWKTLVEPRGYNLDVTAFIDFLKQGIAAYNSDK
ncbi:MAG: cytochrome c biogenesis protein CcdA, partial [Bacteroidales bacterium]